MAPAHRRNTLRSSIGIRGGLGATMVLFGFAAGAAFAAVAQAAPGEAATDAATGDALAALPGGGGEGRGAAVGHELLPTGPRPQADEVAALDDAERVRRARVSREEQAARRKADEAARDRVYAPVTGVITSNYGPRWGTTHYGLDIANKIGTPIRTPIAGKVIDAGPASGFGLWVRIRHDDGTITVYGHINSYSVRPGQRVAAGQVIAEVGNRGVSTGPHLHFEVWAPNGQKVDPLAWLTERGADVGSN